MKIMLERTASVATALTLALACFAAACSGKSSDGGSGGNSGTGGTVFDGGGKIPDPPDGEAACQSGACNYQAQDCPNGQTCMPSPTPPASGDWPPACQTAGSAQRGATCSAWNECALGLFCAGVGVLPGGGVKPGTCRKLCCGGDWSACDSGESCYQQLYLLRPGAAATDDPVYAGADLCGPVGGCDLFDAASCTEAGRTCQLVDPLGNVACLPEGTAGIGEACTTVTRCKSGSICTGGRCRRLCRAIEGGTPACPADEGVCVHYAIHPDGVGSCVEIQGN